MRYYDRTLIITLITGMPLTLLAMSCARKGQPVDIIELSTDVNGQTNPLTDESISKLQSLTGASRLYIFGHCDQGSDILSSDNNQSVHYTYLAQIIATHVNQHVISGLRIALFGCHGAAGSQPNINDSFAAKLHYQLAAYGITNIDVTAYTDSKAIRMSADTLKIHKYSKVDKPILDSLIERKRESLQIAKRKFTQKVKESFQSTTYTHTLIPFIEQELSEDIMLDKNKLKCFSEACAQTYIEDKLYELRHDAAIMSRTLADLFTHQITILVKQALCDAANDAILLMKHNDRNRPFSKVLFSWHESTQSQLDAYQIKAWENQIENALDRENFVIGQAFRQQRSLIDKLSFLHRIECYKYSTTSHQPEPLKTTKR